MSTKAKKKSWDIYDNDIDVTPINKITHDEQYYLRSKKPGDAEDENNDNPYWGFRCFVYPNEPGMERMYWDITDGISEIEWQEDLDSVAMSCRLRVWDSTDLTGARRLTNVMTKGSKISLYVKDVDTNKLKMVQQFVIWEITRKSSSDPYVDYKCYDPLVYLLKSEDTFLFTKKTSPNKKGWTADQITKEICKKYGIPMGFIPKAKYSIPYFRIDSGSVWDVILKAWTEERKKTDVRYIIRMENNKLYVRAKQTKRTFWGVVEGENLIDMSFTDSLEGMATAVRVIAPKEESGGISSSNPVQGGGGALPEEKLEDLGGLRPTTTVSRSATSDVKSSWRKASASSFMTGKETALAYGDPPSSTMRGFAELSTNPGAPSGWDFKALGGLPAYTEIDVKYRGKIITVKKIDVGRGGGPAPGSSAPRGIDLSNTSMRDLTGKSSNLVEVEWRIHNMSLGAVEENPSGRNASAAGQDIIVARKSAVQTYGYLQKLITADAGTSQSVVKKVAINTLNEVGRDNYDASLSTYLLPFLRAGDPIYVRDSGTGLRGRYYCSDVTHTLSADGSRTEVGLNWLDIVPSLEIDSAERAPKQPPQSATGGYGGGSMPGSVPGGLLPTQSGCGPVPGGSWGGGPYKGTHTLGNWQSDNAYDIFAPDGTPCIAVEQCTVTKVSAFNSDPRLWGIGVTVKTASGPSLFYKHFKSVADGIRVGAVLQPRQVIGYLGTGVNGGPHLHFGVEPPASPDQYRNAACGQGMTNTTGSVQGLGDRSKMVKFSIVSYGGNEKEPTVYLRKSIAGPGTTVIVRLNDKVNLTCKVKELPANASKDYGGIISSKTIKKAIPSAIYGNRSYDAVMLVVPTNAVDNLVSGVSNDISDIVSGAGGMW